MKKYIQKISLIIMMLLILTACHSDLDQSPIDPDSFTEKNVFTNITEAKSALAKLYAGLALTGQQGPAGQPDITGIDEGASQYTRILFNLNELTTDNAVVAWGDPGLPEIHALGWSSSNDFTEAMYFRMAQQITFCNSFIANATQLSDSEAQIFIAEARFLRAYSYTILMDFYANVPITKEITTDLPTQSNRKEIFDYVESELTDIASILPESGANEYGRVDRVAAWALLSRIYLNAEAWIGEAKYTECITYSNQVIGSTYTINTNDANNNGSAYDELFLADNDSNGAQNEFIFAVNFDGLRTRTYGGTTFLVHASIGGSMDPNNFGVNGGWAGLRVTKALVNKFNSSVTSSDGSGNPTAWSDFRAMFYTNGQEFEITNISTFTDGYSCTKFKNIDSAGNQGSDSTGDFVDTDLAIIRLAEVYLNYTEAVLRGGTGGNIATAKKLINDLNERAYGNASGNVTEAEITLDFILDERARELYWEGLRRTDLIRYNKFTGGTYLWPFKGGAASGISVGDYRNIFPLPNSVIAANPNLNQNTGY